MTEADTPHPDRDWFRGRAPEAPRAPRPVAEAFGHLRRTEEEAVGESDWFDAGSELREPAAAPSEQVAVAEVSSAPAEADSAATVPTAPDSAAPAEPTPTSTAPDADPRVRLRALTGGLADLSDAMAAIGIESVALRSPSAAAPARPSAPQPSQTADFRVRCPDCGPQYVAVADLRFVETGDGAEANRYLFTCPACGARVRRPAGPELAEILKSSGVATLALRRGPGQAL